MGLFNNLRNVVKRGLSFVNNFSWSNGIANDTILGLSSRSSSFLDAIYTTIANEFSKIDLMVAEGTTADDFKVRTDLELNEVLALRPNAALTSTELLYVIAYQIHKHGNALIYIDRDENGNVVGLSPIDCGDCMFGNTYVLQDGQMFIRVKKPQGNIETINYGDLIHLRLNPNDVFNFDDGVGILGADRIIKVFDSSLQVMLNNLSQSGRINGVLKMGTSSGGFVAQFSEDKKKSQAAELSERIKASKEGVLVIDSGEEFTPITKTSYTMTTPEINELLGLIYELKGINRKVVNGTATNEEMEVFWTKCLAPLVDSLMKELNYKLLTREQRASGMRIDYSRNPFEYLSLSNAIDSLYKGAMFFKKNEIRAFVFKLPPVPDGDTVMENLNFTTPASSESEVKNK